MKEAERNRRLLLLVDKLVADKNLEALELLETMVKNDTPAIQKSFSLFQQSIYNIKINETNSL